MNSTLKFFLILLFSMTLFACSSGGDNDTSAPSAAKIGTANEEDLGTAATEGAKQALDGNSASAFRGSLGVRAVLDFLNESMLQNKSNKIALAPVDLSSMCTGGGSASVDTNSTGSSSVITYANCDIGSAIADGVVNITSSTSGTVTTTNLQYTDFTITIAGEVTTIDLSATCTVDTSSFASSCTYSSDVTGIDGRTYSVSGSTISGNSSSGYTVAATITDPDHGTLSITTTSPILFNCTNGQPSSGEIQFSDGDGVLVTVTFNDCNGFTISYSGSSNVYTW